jgi:thiamine biosynthesis lipoprotein
MVTVRLARSAMATRFELVLHGEDAAWLRAAGEAALAEIDRLEAQLSFYRRSSEVSRINARAADEPVPVEPRLFRLLLRARRLYEETQGAFDVTVAPLMRCWGFVGGTGRLPDPEALAEARARSGMHRVTLDEARRTVAFERPGVMIDLGGIGKGYAVEEAVYLLEEAGVTSAFLHGGTSTIYALGAPPGEAAWNVALPYPDADEASPGEAGVLAVVPLKDEALSVSAVWGKAFEVDGKVYGHVLDPRLGHPVDGAALAAVVLPSATDGDALSTALLVLGRDGAGYLAQRPGLRTLVLFPPGADGRFEVVAQGLTPSPSGRITPAGSPL